MGAAPSLAGLPRLSDGTLAELEPLAHLPTITSLALVDNPVSKLKDYRAFVIALLPRLKVLDYKRVKLAEREEAEARLRHGP